MDEQNDRINEYKTQEEIPCAIEGETILIDHCFDRHKKETDTLHTRSDQFVYVRNVKFNPKSLIQVDMAGITMPDPNYFVTRYVKKSYSLYFVAEYVTSGSGHLVFDGIRQKIQAGDFYIMNTSIEGKYYADKHDPWCKKWINMTGTVPLQLFQAFIIREQVLVLHFDAEKYIDRFLVLLSHREEYTPEELEHQLLMALMDLFCAIHRERNKSLTAPQNAVNIKELTNYIDENLLKVNLSSTVLGENFFVSAKTIDRIFLKEYGITPQKYITTKKMQYAKQFLLEGMKMEEIANRLFYSTEGYFRKVFTNVCGITPLAYRKKFLLDIYNQIKQPAKK